MKTRCEELLGIVFDMPHYYARFYNWITERYRMVKCYIISTSHISLLFFINVSDFTQDAFGQLYVTLCASFFAFSFRNKEGLIG